VNSGLSDRPFPLDVDGKPVNTNPQQEPDKNDKGDDNKGDNTDVARSNGAAAPETTKKGKKPGKR